MGSVSNPLMIRNERGKGVMQDMHTDEEENEKLLQDMVLGMVAEKKSLW